MDDKAKHKSKIKDDDSSIPMVLDLLQRHASHYREGHTPNTLSAIDISVRCGILTMASHERRRRHMRSIIKYLREVGHPIIADAHGYRMADCPKDLTDYAAWRKSNGLGHLVAAASVVRSQASHDINGQMCLFNS